MYGPGKGVIWLDNLGCHGNESHIQDCNHTGWGVSDCTHDEDVGVDCEDDSVGEKLFNLFIFQIQYACSMFGLVNTIQKTKFGTLQKLYYNVKDYIPYI